MKTSTVFKICMVFPLLFSSLFAFAQDASEEVAGRIVQELDAQEKVFWATKVNVAGRGGGSADPALAAAPAPAPASMK